MLVVVWQGCRLIWYPSETAADRNTMQGPALPSTQSSHCHADSCTHADLRRVFCMGPTVWAEEKVVFADRQLCVALADTNYCWDISHYVGQYTRLEAHISKEFLRFGHICMGDAELQTTCRTAASWRTFSLFVMSSRAFLTISSARPIKLVSIADFTPCCILHAYMHPACRVTLQHEAAERTAVWGDETNRTWSWRTRFSKCHGKSQARDAGSGVSIRICRYPHLVVTLPTAQAGKTDGACRCTCRLKADGCRHSMNGTSRAHSLGPLSHAWHENSRAGSGLRRRPTPHLWG